MAVAVCLYFWDLILMLESFIFDFDNRIICLCKEWICYFR